MDQRYMRLLQQHQELIIKDLDVFDIIDDLFSSDVISSEDVEEINYMKNRTDRTRFLLEKISKHGNNVKYRKFVLTLAKSYRWLYDKLNVESNEQVLNDSVEDCLSKGDVPRLPAHYVERAALEREIAKWLKKLSRHNVLVLHGMSGCGKTSAAISVLRNDYEVLDNFGGNVLWVNCATCKTEDDIIAQQTKLLKKAASMYVYTPMDNASLSSFSSSWEELKDQLKHIFSQPLLKESLLVLDGVNEPRVVEAFDIDCKILITTHDIDVVANVNPQVIIVENSFTEKEALTLFALCLQEDIKKLPKHAKKLYEISKGTPFNVTLIGGLLAENKESLKDNPTNWKKFVNKWEKKRRSIFNNNDNRMKTIEVCINSLDANVLPLYKRLAVLPDNVKLLAETISKLWNKEITDAEDILKSLARKSLIAKNYDSEHGDYVYEVHDLIMHYLRDITSDDEMKKLHNDFLNNYNYDNVDNVSCNIPDDGYIAFYIGYHIKETDNISQKWNLFRKLFLDLKFLGNKVRLTGPDDVKMDLDNYENYIVKDELDRKLLQSVQTFLSKHGTDLFHYPCTDMVQTILQHETEGILYTKALATAQDGANSNQLYFDFLQEQDVQEVEHSTIDVKDVITCVCFLGNYVVVGTASGLIKLFHSTKHKLKEELKGMNAPVKWVGVSCARRPIIAGLSQAGVIKLWRIDDSDDEERDVIQEEPDEFYSICSDQITIKQDFGAYNNCRWSANEEFLVAHNAKMIFLFTPTGDLFQTITLIERDKDISCCITCNNDKFVAIATISNGKSVDIIDLKTKEKVTSFEETDDVLDMVIVPGTNKILTLKVNEITEHEYNLTESVGCSRSVIRSEAVKEYLSFKSIAVNKTGTLLFVSTDDSRVLCFNLHAHATYTHEFDLENRRGNVIAMAVSEVLWDELEPGSDVLLTGTDHTENSAKLWYLDATFISQADKRKGKFRLTGLLDVSFLHASLPHTPQAVGGGDVTSSARRHQSFTSRELCKPSRPAKLGLRNTLSLDRHAVCRDSAALKPLLAVVDENNNIQVMRGRKVLMEILEESNNYITCLKISPCNHFIIYGLQSGDVKKFTLRTKEVETIMDVYSPVTYLEYVNPNLLMVAGKNRSLMAYRFTYDTWKVEMLQSGNAHLGSQELLNDMQVMRLSNGDDVASTSSSDAEQQGRRDVLCCAWVGGVAGAGGAGGAALLSVERSGAVKAWARELSAAHVQHVLRAPAPPAPPARLAAAALRGDVLVLADNQHKHFQTFQLSGSALKSIQEYSLDSTVTSCDLTADGNILALGLESGHVMVWNVRAKRIITILKHHKSRVQSCSFSPVPDRLNDEPPLVLVTMATEIVWWNITHFLQARANHRNVWQIGVNAMTPIGTPLESRSEQHAEQNAAHNNNFFFGDGWLEKRCWKDLWKGKTCKNGSKRPEILACVKLRGVSATCLRHDEGFACFVTVDNAGNVHIMNVMKPA